MNKNFFAGKKILLTQYALRFFAGSEIVALELAEQLQKFGAEVTVFAWHVASPLQDEFKKRHLYVTADDFDPRITDTDFDYIWVHHQVLPMGLLNRLQATVQGRVPESSIYPSPRPISPYRELPYFIFYHMSALPDNSLEHPYAAHLEKYFASQSFCVSQESYDFETATFDGELVRPAIFPNQFPAQFLREQPTAQKSAPQRILIVSNHQPAGLTEVATLLAEQGIEVTAIGKRSLNYELVTPDLLAAYDAVITIGKTVQYCFAMGIPVYVYDKFGGCGYLTEENYRPAYYANFSGRGFSHKTPAEIARELVENFAAAQDFQSAHRRELLADFSLERNLPRLFADLPPSTAPHALTDTDFNFIALAEAIARKKISAENLARA